MCGITGVLNLNKDSVPRDIIKKMNDVIAYRGPDGEGIYIDRFIGLGHRRLSIIDLSEAGSQPMISSNKDYVISYNGEIYNFKELRTILESKGYFFKSKKVKRK